MSQPKVRSTSHRLGWTRKPLGAGSERWMTLQAQAGMRGVRAEFFGERAAGIAGIGPESISSRGWARQMAGKGFQGSRAIREAGRGDHHAQQQAQSVDHQMPVFALGSFCPHPFGFAQGSRALRGG
jgi:hypothetical protein